MVQNLVDKALVKLIRDHANSTALRSRFARKYGIEIGGHTIGAFDRWRIPPGTRIGRYCSIAGSARIIDANHPTGSLSTHPVFYMKSMGLVADDQVHSSQTVIEDDVWLGHNCIITPECKRVGRGAVIGAGAVVSRDVPPYAIMIGAPAILARFRFPPDVIEALEATRWWELEPEDLKAATAHIPEFLTNPSVGGAISFITRICREVPDFSKVQDVEPETPLFTEAQLLECLRKEMPEFDDWDTPLSELPIDSFGLINLRLSLEAVGKASISDAAWGRIQTPRDMLRIPGGKTIHIAPTMAQVAPPATEAHGAGEKRSYLLNMPQMALSGLSEAWLFKELGDIHWANITRGLDTTSAAIADDTGSRLYATFTRVRWEAEQPLTSFRENDAFSIDMSASRLGAGIFFGDAELDAPTGSLKAQVMSSFARFGEHGQNTSLLKGQPHIPEGCPIPALESMPAFGLEYRERRSAEAKPVLHETEYALQPPHDINGVGLLYFAAYPTIADLCANAIGGSRLSTEFSTIARDVCYFANCSPDDSIIYRASVWEEDVDGILIEATLSRKSDGVAMASIITNKQRISQAT
jgi:probable biosynthetic protein (TIGR04098 family)